MPSPIWANPAIKQVATYGLGAGVAALGVGGFFRVLRHVSGTSTTQSLSKLKDAVQESDLEVLATDSDLVDLLDRMRDFSIMAPSEFDGLLKAGVSLAKSKHEFDVLKMTEPKKLGFSDARIVRSASQEFIEAIRLMRAVLELQNPSVLDDFDEVATDCHKLHTEINEHVLFDAQLVR